jgi:hypothetical protein
LDLLGGFREHSDLGGALQVFGLVAAKAFELCVVRQYPLGSDGSP